MRNSYNHLNPLPMPVPAATEKSAIEAHFPRIARELSRYWLTDAIEPYMASLLIDNRGGRLGFPEDVLEELMFLSSMLWHLQHVGSIIMDHLRPDEFSFCSSKEADMRLCGTTGGWVLL